MKLAFFVSAFPVVSETFIVNQVIDLKRRGFAVRIFAQQQGDLRLVHQNILENDLLADTVFLEDAPRGRMQKIRRLAKALVQNLSWQNLKLVISVVQNAPRYGLSVYDLAPFLRSDYMAVHAHFGPNGAYVAKLKALGLFGQSRFITSFHGYDLELSVAKSNAYQDLFAVGDFFTVNSNFSKKKLLRLGCPSEKISIMPVGLDTAYFNRDLMVPTGSRPFTILFVGRLIRVKGPDLVIEICRLLKYEHSLDFRAVLVGEGEDRDVLVAAIKRAGIQDIVKLAGAKTQAEVRQLMAEADVFLLPGRTITGLAETQGLVIQEAQAMGLPVIVSDAGGMQEGLISGETGFVLREGDVAAFACKIEDLAKDSACRERMGQVGRKLATSRFDNRLLNSQLIQLYSKIEN